MDEEEPGGGDETSPDTTPPDDPGKFETKPVPAGPSDEQPQPPSAKPADLDVDPGVFLTKDVFRDVVLDKVAQKESDKLFPEPLDPDDPGPFRTVEFRKVQDDDKRTD